MRFPERHLSGIREEGERCARQTLRTFQGDDSGERIPFTENDERRDGKGTQLPTPVIPLAAQSCRDCGTGHTRDVRCVGRTTKGTPARTGVPFILPIRTSHRGHPHFRSCFDSGSERTRLPVVAKMALHSAGITGGSAGSPSPVGGNVLLRKCTSTGTACA